MPYQLSWLLPKRIILMEFSGVMDDAAIRLCDQEMLKMLDEGDPNAALIHQIMVMHDRTSHSKLSVLASLQWLKHPRNGWFVAVAISNPFMRTIGNLASQITRMRAKSVDTFEQGLEFLFYVDMALPKDKSVQELAAEYRAKVAQTVDSSAH